MKIMEKLLLIVMIFNLISVLLNAIDIAKRESKYDSLFAKCEQDKEIEIYGNKYWCVKIQNKKGK